MRPGDKQQRVYEGKLRKMTAFIRIVFVPFTRTVSNSRSNITASENWNGDAFRRCHSKGHLFNE